jgi:isopentenyl phosphate kinase
MDLIIIKIGGSVITRKEKNKPEVNFKNLRRVVNELSVLKQKFILIHGVGSFGHPIVKRTGIHKGISKDRKQDAINFAETQRLQNQLNCIVVRELIKKGVPAFPCQASDHAVMKKGRLVKMELETIKGLLYFNIVPTFYGVPAYDREQGCSILSGDQIASYLGEKLKAKKIIMATDVDGVFTADPKKDKKAKQIKEINKNNLREVQKVLRGSSVTDVTGGMAGKVAVIIKIAKKGIPIQIISALKKGNIKKAFGGEKVGTLIKY